MDEIIEGVKEFDTIEEVIEYLKNNNKVDPFYKLEVRENGDEVWVRNGFYDMRLFAVPRFLRKNEYIYDKYYGKGSNEKLLYLFHQPLTIEDIDKFDIEKVSYLILRGYNIERISEGTIKYLLEEGLLLRLVERSKELKEKETKGGVKDERKDK